MSDETNLFVLTGTLVEKRTTRRSPAGIVHVDFELEHQSIQNLDLGKKLLKCKILARATGEALVKKVLEFEIGDHILVEGPLSWESSKEELNRLVVMVTTIENRNSQPIRTPIKF